jgi:glycosyltransferase involved in cell wall biosynthesis
MTLSVVVPTLNGRDQLAAGLDALAAHAPDAEVIVVNGPSADGTTGMVRNRDDVDVLVEISDRTVNVARNAGIEVASGDRIALVDYDNRVGPSWLEGVRSGLERGDVVTGPVCRSLPAGRTAERSERRRIAGREVAYFAGGNVAFRASVLYDLDGFDEHLPTGGSRDLAHRLATHDHELVWEPEATVRHEPGEPAAADGGEPDHDWRWKYRALAYRLAKNYGLRPTVLRRIGSHAVGDATSVARDVLSGEATPSGWVGNGRDVVAGTASGFGEGMAARARDRSPKRNPNGISKRADRAVAKYDWREDAA